MTPLQKSILNAVKRRPMTLREMQNNLQVDNSRLRTTVSAMGATGELSMRNGTYVPGFATYENAAAPNTIPCTLVKLAARFGFASRDDGEGDIFIPGRALHGAMPNDKINVKLFDHPRVEGSSEGEVVEVTVPNNRFAGTVCLSEDGRMAVEPDGCRDVKFLLAKQGSEGVHRCREIRLLRLCVRVRQGHPVWPQRPPGVPAGGAGGGPRLRQRHD